MSEWSPVRTQFCGPRYTERLITVGDVDFLLHVWEVSKDKWRWEAQALPPTPRLAGRYATTMLPVDEAKQAADDWLVALAKGLQEAVCK